MAEEEARYFSYPPNPPATWPRMTYGEYMAWSDEDTWAEWVDGEIVQWERMTLAHQELLGWTSRVVGHYARWLDLGEVIPLVGVHLSSRPSLRLPDVVYVAPDHRDRLTPTVIEGPPDLIVEIVSDDSVHRDQIEKRDEYAAAGVREYWWLDPRPGQQQARFLRLAEDGRFEDIEFDEGERFHSLVLPGFWLDRAWLWQDPLPDPLGVLARIAPDAFRAFVLKADDASVSSEDS